MSTVLLYLIVFIISPLTVFLIQAVINRVLVTQSPQARTILSMVLGYPVFFGVLYFIPFSHEERTFAFYGYVFLAYSFSSYTYFHIFNMSETSRRVRMLMAIQNEKTQNLKNLGEIYDERQMIQARLNRLVSLRQIKILEGLYYPKGRIFLWTSLILYFVGLLLDRPWETMKRFKASQCSQT